MVVSAIRRRISTVVAPSSKAGSSANPSSKEESAVATRLLLTHLQGLSVLAVLRAKGTALFKTLVESTEDVSASPLSWGPVRCAIGAGFHSRFWVTMLLPLIVLLLTVVSLAVLEALRWCGERVRRPRRPQRDLLATRELSDELRDLGRAVWAEVRSFVVDKRYGKILTTVLFLTYMPIVGQAVRALECRDRTIGGVLFLRSDLEVECYAGAHVAAALGAVVIGIVLIGLGLPLGLYLALRNPSREVPDLKFLTRGYDVEKGLRWWESLVLLRKTGLVLSAALVTDPIVQGVLTILVLGISLALQLQHKPFSLPRFNQLETLSLSCLAMTVIFSLIYLQWSGGADTLDLASSAALSPAAEALSSALLIGGNLIILALLVGEMCRARLRSIGCRRAASRLRDCVRRSAGLDGGLESRGGARHATKARRARRSSASETVVPDPRVMTTGPQLVSSLPAPGQASQAASEAKRQRMMAAIARSTASAQGTTTPDVQRAGAQV